MFLVGIIDQKIVASVMAGYDGHRGWANYLAVDPDRRGEGLGRVLMDRVESMLKKAGCPKINIQVRRDNLVATEFYHAIGYRDDDVVSLGKRLEPDEPE